MGNPYQYSGSGQGFLTDYSSLAGAGSAFESFAKSFGQAQEASAQREALKTKMQREKDQTAIEALKGGYESDGAGGFREAKMTQRQRDAAGLAASEKGMNVDYDENGHITHKAWDPHSPQILGATLKQEKYGTEVNDKHNKRWSEFATKLNDPSARAQFGKYQSNIDRANTLKTFERTLGMPPGEQAPDGETDKQRIARYDRANPSDLFEVAKAADSLLSNAQATVYSTDHLMPKDVGIAGSTIQQWLSNKAVPANSGEFINKFMNLANREGKYYQSARDRAVKAFTAGYEDLRPLDSGRWERAMSGQSAFEGPAPASPPQGKPLVGAGLVTQTPLERGAPQAATAPPPTAHPEAAQALAWAKNPKSPGWTKEKAAVILQRLGQQ